MSESWPGSPPEQWPQGQPPAPEPPRPVPDPALTWPPPASPTPVVQWSAGTAPLSQRVPRHPIAIVAVLLLAAASLRDIAAIVAAIIGWSAYPFATHGQELGNGLLWAGDLGDGQGVLLLLAILAIIWRYARSPAPAVLPDAPSGNLGRGKALVCWTLVLFILAILGSVAYTVGTFFYDAGLGTKSSQWQHFVGTGGFYVAYAIVGIAGLYAAIHLMSGFPPKLNPPTPAAGAGPGSETAAPLPAVAPASDLPPTT